MKHRPRTGFTIVELMISITVLGILAALAIPLVGDSEALRLDAASRLLTSDLEHTQILAITHPQDGYCLVVHTDGSGWHIALTSDPDTPVLETITDDPLSVRVGEGRGAPARGVLLTTNASNNIIAFDPNGGLTDFTLETEINLNIGNSEEILSIAVSTGSIRYTEN
jgi:prepilin-type N-terminal cleavage/methylation domain-containing protein